MALRARLWSRKFSCLKIKSIAADVVPAVVGIAFAVAVGAVVVVVVAVAISNFYF